MSNKCKATTDIYIYMKPNKLMRRKLQNLNQDTKILNHLDINLFKKSMYLSYNSKNF